MKQIIECRGVVGFAKIPASTPLDSTELKVVGGESYVFTNKDIGIINSLLKTSFDSFKSSAVINFITYKGHENYNKYLNKEIDYLVRCLKLGRDDIKEEDLEGIVEYILNSTDSYKMYRYLWNEGHSGKYQPLS